VTVRNPALEDLARQVVEELPGAYGPLTVQAFIDQSGAATIIELNARFGGGFPLSYRAGADYPRWMIEEALGLPSTASTTWQEGLVMLRYDDAVFIDGSSAGLA
jgi:carbamoyl-phosphate synthase large subunit